MTSPNMKCNHYDCVIVILLMIALLLQQSECALPSPKFPMCQDKDRRCEAWSEMKECKRNPEWMLVNCRCACSEKLGVPMESFPDVLQYLWVEESNGWTIRSGCLRGHNSDRPWHNVQTMRQCVDLCKDEKRFECLSVDYRPFDHVCSLSAMDSNSAPDDYYEPCYLDFGMFNTWYAERRKTAEELNCVDEYPDCRAWAVAGDCQMRADWMHEHCCHACKTLPPWFKEKFEKMLRENKQRS